MDAIHINWTKPFRNKFNAPYEIEDFEILTTILSALKWREKNGNIKMVTDSVGAQYYKKTGLDVIWNSVENILDNVDVNSNVFWAAGKIFALKEQNAPVAMIDTDFVVWEKLDEEKLADVSVIHFENLYPDVYPPIDFFHMDNYEFDIDFDWNIKACNTAFCVIKTKNCSVIIRINQSNLCVIQANKTTDLHIWCLRNSVCCLCVQKSSI